MGSDPAVKAKYTVVDLQRMAKELDALTVSAENCTELTESVDDDEGAESRFVKFAFQGRSITVTRAVMLETLKTFEKHIEEERKLLVTKFEEIGVNPSADKDD